MGVEKVGSERLTNLGTSMCAVHDNNRYRCKRCGKCFVCEHELNDVWWRCADGIEIRTNSYGDVIEKRKYK
jgi:hypothetical protein